MRHRERCTCRSSVNIRLAGLALLVAALAGCASSSAPRPNGLELHTQKYATVYASPDGTIVTKYTVAAKDQPKGWWKGDGVPGKASIVIDLGDQHARFYKGGVLVGESPVSTGREGYATPTGEFRIIQKDKDHRSNLYGDWVDAEGKTMVSNIGIEEDPRPPGAQFRGAPMPYYMRVVNGVGMHAGYLPGVPDSHGCIRMPMGMAEIFYNNASNGTPVTIKH